jgi:surfeit locus 1 family protein
MRFARLIPTLATVVAVAVFVSAGNWQGRRLAEKERLRSAYDAAAVQPEVPLPNAGTEWNDWIAWRYRPVRVTGEYDGARQILIDNKVHAGRAGYHVITPLDLADGRVVLVDRGWVAAGADRAHPPVVPPPAGAVVVAGRIALPSAGYLEFGDRAATGPVWQNLDPARFAAATGVPVLPVVVEETAPAASPDGLVRERPAPDFGADKHRIYRAQWYAFAVLAAGLWAGFGLRAIRKRRSEQR